MKYVLVKYKKIKLLINDGLHMQPLIEHLTEIEQLNDAVNDFYKNLLTATSDQGAELETRKRELTSKIGYKIIGVPFTGHDAELYALDKNISYDELELHGNTNNKNAQGDIQADAQLQVRLNKSVKNKFVKKAQSENMKLSQWILKVLNLACDD